MLLERLLERQPQPPLEALDPLDDPLDVDVEIGQVAAELARAVCRRDPGWGGSAVATVLSIVA